MHCECPVYATIINPFMKESDNLLGGVNTLNKFNSQSIGFILECENWHRFAFLRLVNDY